MFCTVLFTSCNSVLLLQQKLSLKNLIKTQILLTLFCFVWMDFAQAQNQTSYTEETAKLLEQVNLKTVDGREMAEVPLKLVLQLAIDRSILMQISSLGNQAALHAVTAAQERNTPSLTTSF